MAVLDVVPGTRSLAAHGPLPTVGILVPLVGRSLKMSRGGRYDIPKPLSMTRIPEYLCSSYVGAHIWATCYLYFSVWEFLRARLTQFGLWMNVVALVPMPWHWNRGAWPWPCRAPWPWHMPIGLPLGMAEDPTSCPCGIGRVRCRRLVLALACSLVSLSATQCSSIPPVNLQSWLAVAGACKATPRGRLHE